MDDEEIDIETTDDRPRHHHHHSNHSNPTTPNSLDWHIHSSTTPHHGHEENTQSPHIQKSPNSPAR